MSHENQTLLFTIAQDGIPAPGEGIPAPGEGVTGQAADGSTGAAPAPRSPFGDWLLPALLLGFVLLMVFSMRGNSREKKRREKMISSIRKHDEVQTIGGVIGSVVEVKQDRIVLKVDESHNTRMTFARSAVQQVLSDRGDGALKEEKS